MLCCGYGGRGLLNESGGKECGLMKWSGREDF